MIDRYSSCSASTVADFSVIRVQMYISVRIPILYPQRLAVSVTNLEHVEFALRLREQSLEKADSVIQTF